MMNQNPISELHSIFANDQAFRWMITRGSITSSSPDNEIHSLYQMAKSDLGFSKEQDSKFRLFMALHELDKKIERMLQETSAYLRDRVDRPLDQLQLKGFIQQKLLHFSQIIASIDRLKEKYPPPSEKEIEDQAIKWERLIFEFFKREQPLLMDELIEHLGSFAEWAINKQATFKQMIDDLIFKKSEVELIGFHLIQYKIFILNLPLTLISNFKNLFPEPEYEYLLINSVIFPQLRKPKEAAPNEPPKLINIDSEIIPKLHSALTQYFGASEHKVLLDALSVPFPKNQPLKSRVIFS